MASAAILTREQLKALRERAKTAEQQKAREEHDERCRLLQESGIKPPASGTFGKPRPKG